MARYERVANTCMSATILKVEKRKDYEVVWTNQGRFRKYDWADGKAKPGDAMVELQTSRNAETGAEYTVISAVVV